MSAQLDRFPSFLRDMLKDCPVAGSGVHRWLFNCARHLLAHIDEPAIFDLLKERTRNCGRTVPNKEIRRQIVCSRSVGWQPRNSEAFARTYPGTFVRHRAHLSVLSPTRPPWPKPGLELIREIVATGSSLHDLWERSPVRFDDGASHAEEIIDTLFPGNTLLCCGQSSERFATRRRETWRGHLSRLSFIVSNPMLAVTGQTQEGKLSEHTKEATASRIYLVVEFDFSEFARDGKVETEWAPLVREWKAEGVAVTDACAALHLHLARRLPLVAAVHSGGKSLHGWYSAFNHIEDQLHAFMKYAVQLGADRATWTRSQFVRMPDGTREGGERQICYYLNAEDAVKV